MDKPKASQKLKDTSSKVIVITPEQIKKMGLESDVKSAALKVDKSDKPDNLILNIRSKLSTLLKPEEKVKRKPGETIGGVTFKRIPIKKDVMPMGKLTRISMVKDKPITTYEKSDKTVSKQTIDSRILNMRTMLSKKMASDNTVESTVQCEVKQAESTRTVTDVDKPRTIELSTIPCSNKKIQILSVVPLNADGKLNDSSDTSTTDISQEESISLQNIDFVEDDKVHESKNAVSILHFRNASGAVIELFHETSTKSDEEESIVSQGTEESEKQEENGSSIEDMDDNSDGDVDRSKFKSYLKYSKFKRTKPVTGVKISEEIVESELNEPSNVQSSTFLARGNDNEEICKESAEPKLSDEDEVKDIVELKPVPIIQRTVSNASSEGAKAHINKASPVVNSGDDKTEVPQQADDGLKPILKRKMSTASISEDSTGTPVKRGRGRPKKSLSEDASPPKIKPDQNPGQSPVKSPSKKKLCLAEDGTPIVKKRGRPPKVWSKDDLSGKTAKPPPKVEVTSVKTYSKKEPIASVPITQLPKCSPIISKVPSMIKLEMDIGPETSIVIKEERLERETIKTPSSLEKVKPKPVKKSTPTTSVEDTPTTPRKRGRPKKSTSVTPVESPPYVPRKIASHKIPRDLVVSRSGRKRKKIDYSAMNEGASNSDDSYAEDEPPVKPDSRDKDFEELPIRSSFNKEYEHKVYPAKRKSFKSESDTNEIESSKGVINMKEASTKTTESAEELRNTEKKCSSDVSIKSTDETPKKKRGRPKKNPEPFPSKNNLDKSLIPKKIAVLKPLVKTPDEQSQHDNTVEQNKEQITSPAQSRKRELSVDAAFAFMFNMIAKESDGPHPINIYAKAVLNAKSPLAEDRGTVICALCESEVPMKSFSGHNLTKHNNLGWTIGGVVLDLSNYGLVLGIYTDMYKSKQKFICDRKCGTVKKSVMGYLSHYIVCQKTAEEVEDMKKACEACGRLMMPYYYVNHLKDCKKNVPDESQDLKQKSSNHNVFDSSPPQSDSVKLLTIQQLLGHMLNTIKANKSGVNAINVYLRMDLEDLEKREPPPEGLAICALCNMEMDSSKFESHNLSSHNNLSWKIGEPKLELDKYESVIPTLNTMYSQRHPFVCEQCSTEVKSVWGFLWHVSACGKSKEEVDKGKLDCPICQLRVAPTNYIAHTRTCESKVHVHQSSTAQDEDGVLKKRGAKNQRAAATKATQFIQQLTTTDHEKSPDGDVLSFFYADHKFYKSKRLTDFMQKRMKHQKNNNCLFEDCSYLNEDLELLICHLFTCLKKPKKNFICKICFSILNNKNEANLHMYEKHKEELESKESESSSSSSEEQDNEEVLERDKKNIRRENNVDIELTPWELLRIQDLRLYKSDYTSKVHFMVTKHLSTNFPTAFKWNIEFIQQNFSTNPPCSNNSFSDWNSVLPNNILPYIPKLRTSFHATFIKSDECTTPKQKLYKDYDWISLKLFEVQRTNDSWTLFCGGPVHSMSWAPVHCPDDDEACDQYLAVSVISDPDFVVKQGQIKVESSLVQIWNFGPLQVEKSMFEAKDFKPHLEYCLAHKHGDYCCMEWCPSGRFSKSRCQLGLLAIGGTDSFVHIYEMPLGVALNKQRSIIFEATPKYKLESMKLNEMDYSDKRTFPTSISWTKAKDHRYIAVGYCSGLLAIFDIFTESPHLKSVSKDNIIVIKPYLLFAGHVGTVKAISLHHMHGGNRWLASFSTDRTHKLWDLENHSQPVYVFTRFHMVDGIWPTHWLTTMIAFDDVPIRGRGGSTAVFFPIKRFTGSYFNFHNYFTRTNSLAVSDWSNMIAYCNVIGQVVGGFVNTCIPTTSHGMPAVRNYNISFNEIIDKTVSSKEAKKRDLSRNVDEFNGIVEEISYAPAKKRYGIIFSDAPINCYKKLEAIRRRGLKDSKVESKINRHDRPAMYPLRSVTKVAINPNQQAHNYIGVGYQLGFLRIFCPYLYEDTK